MLQFFWGCFIAGLALIIISFLFGQFFDLIGIDGLDLSGLDWNIPIPFSPLLCCLFVTIFGGIGILLDKTQIPLIGILIVGSVAGFIVCRVIHKCVLIPLKKAENTSAPEMDELIGLLGKVQEKIPSGGFGEITYIYEGNTYVAPAKATSNECLITGTVITICWIKDHVFYVSKIDNFN